MNAEQESEHPKWRALESTERRVLGVLIEKAKTTPDNYPITIAALVSGCNQKSNRAPQMQLDHDDVEISLDRLRSVGVVVEVQGSGRVPKYRHTAYDWFDVKGPEIAVLTELLLRGPQTTGELRTRASRMESFQDIAELQPVLDSLQSKKLAIALTPAGRGQLFAHNLYPERELAQLTQQMSVGGANASIEAAATPSSPAASPPSDLQQLRDEVARLAEEVAQLKQRLDTLESR